MIENAHEKGQECDEHSNREYFAILGGNFRREIVIERQAKPVNREDAQSDTFTHHVSDGRHIDFEGTMLPSMHDNLDKGEDKPNNKWQCLKPASAACRKYVEYEHVRERCQD